MVPSTPLIYNLRCLLQYPKELLMRRILMSALLCLTAMLPLSAANTEEQALYGVTAGSSRTERKWESKLRAIPDAKRLRDAMQRLSARPHHVGSPYDKDNAEWILAQFKSWGLDAQIETFDVLFPTPKERVVELLEPTHYTAKLLEPPVAGDPTSSQQNEQLPTYNAYSIDGDVTGRLVYVNYGLPRDYEQLDRLGISVKGAIVIARYGQTWRGIKPKVAAEHGAIACIIYSDPKDDGYFQGDVYPDGPYRGWGMIQRGSVMDMPRYPGDPSTPDRPSKPGVERIPMDKIETFAPIPVEPMSYRDGIEMLKRLKGPVAPPEWRGALPITYRIGPGPAKVHMRVKMDYSQRRVID